MSLNLDLYNKLFQGHSKKFCSIWSDEIAKSMNWSQKDGWIEVPNLFNNKKELVYLPFLNFTCDEAIKKIANKSDKDLFQVRLIDEEKSSQALKLNKEDLKNRKQDYAFDKNELLSMRLNLKNDLWNKIFTSNLRRKIRKAQKSNFEVILGEDEELVNKYYALYNTCMKKYGMPVYPKLLLNNLVNSEIDLKILIIKKNDKPIAGLVLILDEELAWIPWAATNKAELSDYCNYLLYWEAINYSKEKGIKIFDFGRCSFGSSSYKFKRQFGTYHVVLKTMSNSKKNIYSKYLVAQYFWRLMPMKLKQFLDSKIIYYLPDL